MKLTVKERVVLLNIIPKEGDFKTLKQIRNVREALGFSDEESNLLKFVNQGTGIITWTEPKDGEFHKKDVKIPDSVMELIVDALVQADKNKKLNDDTFAIYEKFVVNAGDNVE